LKSASPTRILFGEGGNWRAEEVNGRGSTAVSSASPRYGAERWPGYNSADTDRLEASVLLFLFHLGVLRQPRPGVEGDMDPTHVPPASREPAMNPPARISDGSVLPYIRNGTLLCRGALAAGAPRMLGTYECPRVAKTCVANIEKAFESLRELPGMSHVYLSAAEEVYKGNLRVILPLFEDVIKCAERRTPRRHRVQPGDRPYISPHFSPQIVQQQIDEFRAVPSARRSRSRGSARGVESGRAGVRRPTPRSTPPRGLEGGHARRSAATRSSSAGRREYSRDPPAVRRSPALARSSSAPPRPQTPPRPHQYPSGSSRPAPRPAHRTPRSTPEKRRRADPPEEQQLRRWLQSVWPAAPPLEGHALGLWSDGSALAELVRRVEHDSSLLAGVVARAQKRAQCRNNVNLVLETLNSRRHVLDGMSYLPDEVRDGVIEAHPRVLWELLLAIKRAYGCRGGQVRRRARPAQAEVAVLAPEALGGGIPAQQAVNPYASAPAIPPVRAGRSRQPLRQGGQGSAVAVRNGVPAGTAPAVTPVAGGASRVHPHARARSGTPR